VDLVLDAVDAGHHHRGEREVRVARRIREAHFDAARFGLVTSGMRTAAERLRAEYARLIGASKPGHQALVGVRARVGDRVQRARVLDDAADVVQRELGQPE
jgi:hypothetical protein